LWYELRQGTRPRQRRNTHRHVRATHDHGMGLYAVGICRSDPKCSAQSTTYAAGRGAAVDRLCRRELRSEQVCLAMGERQVTPFGKLSRPVLSPLHETALRVWGTTVKVLLREAARCYVVEGARRSANAVSLEEYLSQVYAGLIENWPQSAAQRDAILSAWLKSDDTRQRLPPRERCWLEDAQAWLKLEAIRSQGAESSLNTRMVRVSPKTAGGRPAIVGFTFNKATHSRPRVASAHLTGRPTGELCGRVTACLGMGRNVGGNRGNGRRWLWAVSPPRFGNPLVPAAGRDVALDIALGRRRPATGRRMAADRSAQNADCFSARVLRRQFGNSANRRESRFSCPLGPANTGHRSPRNSS
jgi:hypothetical protein